MLIAFRLLYSLATILCLSPAVLVTASLFIADRAPQSAQTLAISLFVSGAFLAIGILLFGIQRRIVAIAIMARGEHGGGPDSLERHVSILLVYLICGGMALCGILALLTYAILRRIDQGFAVFG